MNENSIKLLDRGKALFAESKFAEAAQIYSKLLIDEPKNVRCLLNRASCSLNLRNWEDVLQDATAARKEDLQSLKAWRLSGRALDALNDVNGAIDCLHEALHIDVTDSETALLLKKLVSAHLKKILQDSKVNDYGSESLESVMANAPKIMELINKYPERIEERKICLTQLWSSLNTLIESGNLSNADTETAKQKELAVLNNIGIVCRPLNENRLALACHLLCLHMNRDEALKSTLTANVALDWNSMGRTELAIEFMSSAITLDGTKPSAALCQHRNQLGLLFVMSGRYDRAVRVLRAAQKMAEEEHYTRELGKALVYIGIAYQWMDNYEQAIPALQRAVEISREVRDPEGVSMAYRHWGLCSLFQRKFEDGLRYLNESYKAYPTPYNQLLNNVHLGMGYQAIAFATSDEGARRDHLQKAQECFQTGLRIAIDQKDVTQTISLHGNLGSLLPQIGQWTEGMKHQEEALKLAQETGQKQIIGNICLRTAENWTFKIDSDPSALHESEKWLEKTEEYYSDLWTELKFDIDMLNWDSGETQMQFSGRYQMVKWLLDKKLEALSIAERYRARSLREVLRNRASAQNEQVKICDADDMKSLAHKMGNAIIYFTQLKPVKYLCWIIKPDCSDIIPIEIDIPQGVFKYQINSESEGNKNLESENTDISHILRGKAEKLTVARTFTLNCESLNEAEYKEQWRNLYKHIWKPIKAHLNYSSENNCKIFIVPDGLIWDVPHASLIDESEILLLHKYTMSIAPSITALKSWNKSGFTSDKSDRIALVIGNPELSIENTRISSTPDLPIATIESFQVKQALEQKGSVVHLTGRAATKQAVVQSLLTARTFHIASHATLSANDIAAQLPGCLLLSPDSPSDPESGTLTAEEVQALDLRGLRLAFLNCCLTGAGRLYAEGLVGLARAFLYAGAQDVVVSRNPVSDNPSTCAFVNKFYEEYLMSGEANVALNKAQVYMEQLGISAIEWGSYYVICQMN